VVVDKVVNGEVVCTALNGGKLPELRSANVSGKPRESGRSFLSQGDLEALEFCCR
jgi:pyruvate kinase